MLQHFSQPACTSSSERTGGVRTNPVLRSSRTPHVPVPITACSETCTTPNALGSPVPPSLPCYPGPAELRARPSQKQSQYLGGPAPVASVWGSWAGSGWKCQVSDSLEMLLPRGFRDSHWPSLSNHTRKNTQKVHVTAGKSPDSLGPLSCNSPSSFSQ